MVLQLHQIEFTIKTIYSCHCLDYRDTILALKASGVSNSTMSGASRFQSRTVLGKNDIFLVSIREDGIWASLFIGHAAQKSKLHNLQYDEGGNHITETET
jgi:hypothetical protein